MRLYTASGEEAKWILSNIHGNNYMIHTASGKLLFLSHANGKVSLTDVMTKYENWEVLLDNDMINSIKTPEGEFLDIASSDFLNMKGGLSSNMWKITRY